MKLDSLNVLSKRVFWRRKKKTFSETIPPIFVQVLEAPVFEVWPSPRFFFFKIISFLRGGLRRLHASAGIWLRVMRSNFETESGFRKTKFSKSQLDFPQIHVGIAHGKALAAPWSGLGIVEISLSRLRRKNSCKVKYIVSHAKRAQKITEKVEKKSHKKNMWSQKNIHRTQSKLCSPKLTST